MGKRPDGETKNKISTSVDFMKQVERIIGPFCESLGYEIVTFLRMMLRYVGLVLGILWEVFTKAKLSLIHNLKVFIVRNGFDLEEVANRYASIKEQSKKASSRGLKNWVSYWASLLSKTASDLGKKIISTPNYLMPLLSAMAFIIIVNTTINMNFALKVVYDGKEVGYIADESVFNKAKQQMEGRIIYEEYIEPEDLTPEFTICVVTDKKLMNSNLLTNELIRASGNELTEAFGLYVDDTFMGAVKDGEQIIQILDQVKAPYRTGDPTETIEFTKKVEVRDGLYPVTSVTGIAKIKESITTEEVAERIYTTQAGDAPLSIASKNNIPYKQLVSLNPEIEKKLLIGQEILVTKSVPFLGVKVVREIEYTEETKFKIQQVQDKNQAQGYVKVTQKGQNGENLITAKVIYLDGVETEREIISKEAVKEPIDEVVVVGGKTPLATVSSGQASSGFRWPVDGGRLSAGINAYKGHTGMDIAANTGTAIRAAASGTVTMVKYNTTGYGYHLMISHGGGVETLYAHTSKIYVKQGQWVNQGDLIAAVGNTGRSTGPHCHFEIRINGRYMDPAKYIGTRYPY